MALAVSNVIAEGMLVEKSRGESQEFASHLQAVVHGAQAIGSIIAAYFGGLLLGFLADRHVFMLCAFFPLCTVMVAMMAPERKFAGDLTSIRKDMKGKLKELWDTFLRPEIFRPAAFIFLLNSTPSTGSTWFFFYTDVLHFSSTLMGTINVVGAIFSLCGESRNIHIYITSQSTYTHMICMKVRVCVYIYIYIYIHLHTYTHTFLDDVPRHAR